MKKTRRTHHKTFMSPHVKWLMNDAKKYAAGSLKVVGGGWLVKHRGRDWVRVYVLRLYEVVKARTIDRWILRKISDIAWVTLNKDWLRPEEKDAVQSCGHELAEDLGRRYGWAFYENARHHKPCPEMVRILYELEEVHERCQCTSSPTS